MVKNIGYKIGGIKMLKKLPLALGFGILLFLTLFSYSKASEHSFLKNNFPLVQSEIYSKKNPQDTNPITFKVLYTQENGDISFRGELKNTSNKKEKIIHSDPIVNIKVIRETGVPRVVFADEDREVNKETYLKPTESVIDEKPIKLGLSPGKYRVIAKTAYSWNPLTSNIINHHETAKTPIIINGDNNQQHENDILDQIDNELQESVGTDVKAYKKFIYSNLDDIKEENLWLRKLYSEEVDQLAEGDYLPVIYIKKNEGYMLVKKRDGTNIIYSLSKTPSNQWSKKLLPVD